MPLLIPYLRPFSAENLNPLFARPWPWPRRCEPQLFMPSTFQPHCPYHLRHHSLIASLPVNHKPTPKPHVTLICPPLKPLRDLPLPRPIVWFYLYRTTFKPPPELSLHCQPAVFTQTLNPTVKPPLETKPRRPSSSPNKNCTSDFHQTTMSASFVYVLGSRFILRLFLGLGSV